jgi:hypothetical protein
MSSTPQIQAQSLATESIGQLMEFDFRSIGGTQRVYVANTQENEGTFANLDITWDGAERTFQHIDFSMSNLRSDLTGQVAEPTLRIAAHDLFAISSWASATTNFTMMDYRGLKIKRMRLFFNTPTLIDPHTYFVKSVDELSAEQMVFTLTASLGTENGNKPSARKLEI